MRLARRGSEIPGTLLLCFSGPFRSVSDLEYLCEELDYCCTLLPTAETTFPAGSVNLFSRTTTTTVVKKRLD